MKAKEEHSHVNMRWLEAALVNVVMREGLCGVGAVLIHSDGHFALGGNTMSHTPAFWTQTVYQDPGLSV